MFNILEFLHKRRNRYLFSILSGLLLSLSFPEIGDLFPLIFIALVPLYSLSEYARLNNKKGIVFLHSYITFCIYNILCTWWIYYASAGGAMMAFFCNTLLFAIAFWIAHLLNKKTQGKYPIFIFSSIWLGFESLHFYWDLSWPWLTYGNVFAKQNYLIQWYSITGVLGGSLWVLVINGFLFKWSLKKQMQTKKSVAILGVLILAPIAFSILQYTIKDTNGRTIPLIVLQPNEDPYNSKFTKSGATQYSELMHQVEIARNANKWNTKISKNTLIFAPETALFPDLGGLNEEEIPAADYVKVTNQFLQKWQNSQLIIGASTYRIFDKKHSHASQYYPDFGAWIENYNSSLFFDGKNVPQIIHKSHLVLGVEKIPFAKSLPFLGEMAIDLGGTSGILGIENAPKILKTKFGKIAPVICYESVYPKFIAEQSKQGAELIGIITNDGWWENTPGYKQHFAFARIRAIENDRYVVRSANTGRSGIIDNRGTVLKETAWWEETQFATNVNLRQSKTIYTQISGILDYLILFSVLFALFLAFKPKKKCA